MTGIKLCVELSRWSPRLHIWKKRESSNIYQTNRGQVGFQKGDDSAS